MGEVTEEKLRIQAFRLGGEAQGWLDQEMATRNVTGSKIVTECVEAMRTWHGMPLPAIRLLEEKAKATGLTRDQYMQSVVYEHLMRLQGVGATTGVTIKDIGKKPSSK